MFFLLKSQFFTNTLVSNFQLTNLSYFAIINQQGCVGLLLKQQTQILQFCAQNILKESTKIIIKMKSLKYFSNIKLKFHQVKITKLNNWYQQNLSLLTWRQSAYKQITIKQFIKSLNRTNNIKKEQTNRQIDNQ
ncbi:hypothetical protein ABPG72_009380 [Tetrahymena utriculariae]